MRTAETMRLAAAGMLALALVGCADFKRFAYGGFGRRDRWQQPERVVEALGIAPGDRVADLGAGGGYFTFRLADAVGPTGEVYAVDVDAAMTRHIASRADEEGYGNVTAILAGEDDPGLPADGVDLLFVANTFHHLTDRSAYFRNAAGYLRPDARVAIIDYSGAGYGLPAALQRLWGHVSPRETIQTEMEAAGYTLEREHAFLSRQAFLIFTRGGPER